MNRRTFAIRGLVAVAAALTAGVALAADKPTVKPKVDDPQSFRSAVRFAMTYTNAFQAGKGAQAVEEGWDFDSILADIFGKELKKQTAAEVIEIKARFVALVRRHLDNPQVNAAMAFGTFTDYVAKADDDGHVIVSFKFAAGETKIPNQLMMDRRGASWRVVDAETNGQALVMDVRAGYVKVAEVYTPLQFMRLATAELEKEMKAKAEAEAKQKSKR